MPDVPQRIKAPGHDTDTSRTDVRTDRPTDGRANRPADERVDGGREKTHVVRCEILSRSQSKVREGTSPAAQVSWLRSLLNNSTLLKAIREKLAAFPSPRVPLQAHACGNGRFKR